MARLEQCGAKYEVVNQSFPGNDERMSVLHQDSGGIGKSIPSALEIFLGRGFCTPRPSGFPSGFALGKSLGSRGAKPTASENLSDFPRPSRFPSGFALGKSLGSQEISRASGMDFPIPPSSWWSTDTMNTYFWIRLGKWGVESPHLLTGSICHDLRHLLCG